MIRRCTMPKQGGNETVIYMRDAGQCDVINAERRNPRYLSNFTLDVDGPGYIRGICSLVDLETELSAVPGGVVILVALPCQLTPPWFEEHRYLIPPDALLCITSKGLYLKTNQLMGHALLDALDRSYQPLAFLSGPSFAEEIMRGDPTTLVVASDEIFHSVRVQRILSNFRTVRVFTSDDPVGVQVRFFQYSTMYVYYVPFRSFISLRHTSFLCIHSLAFGRHVMPPATFLNGPTPSARRSLEESTRSRCRDGNRDGIRHEYPIGDGDEGVERTSSIVRRDGGESKDDRRTRGHGRSYANLLLVPESQSKVRTASDEGGDRRGHTEGLHRGGHRHRRRSDRVRRHVRFGIADIPLRAFADTQEDNARGGHHGPHGRANSEGGKGASLSYCEGIRSYVTMAL